jgi:hypothetical protein
MILCFFQEYIDEETFVQVQNFKLIAIHYFKKSFIFDFIAWVPIDLIVSRIWEIQVEKLRLFRLFKLLRLPRLVQIFDTNKFRRLVKDYYRFHGQITL